MDIKVAPVQMTKMLFTGINMGNYKVKACPGLFERAKVNYYNRIERLYNDVINEGSLKEYKRWYYWNDGIQIMIINKGFGALYTGSVVYGFTIDTTDPDANTLHNMEFTKYYQKGKAYIKRNPNMVFELEMGRHSVKLRGVWTGFRSKYKDMSQKEVWQHNLETIQRVRGYFGYSDEFIDGYSKAINEYLATL